ncbi:hypothetical protein CIL05_07650 [Virgibacillus profundi]|uniref:Uncharacterized protein n=1 Tax=Virgibacillus profundi TaxID=2024555 RepID=A0A2A2IG92_9BACI|nr:hypothetical protein [Virgibacillus profundi]PAV30336.1 hypothetical protein CIL05_07650 [Virgibacillus profundi]PXY54508.1 hypothetical protein CIT14_07735 [Virgibacillus profundi]
MGKIKVTKKQAKILDYFKKNYERTMGDLTYGNFYLALCDGYEVEPEFEIGEFTKINNDELNLTRKILSIYQINKTKFADLESAEQIPISMLIKLSPEEIKQEREWRWWNKHDRKIGELRKGDTLISNTGCLFFVRDSNGIAATVTNATTTQRSEATINIKTYFNDGAKVHCFAEGRLDLNVDE